MGLQNQEMRQLRTELVNKDAIIEDFEADRVAYQGVNAENLQFLYQAYFYTADILSNADAINKDKEFTAEGGIDESVLLPQLHQQVLLIPVNLELIMTSLRT